MSSKGRGISKQAKPAQSIKPPPVFAVGSPCPAPDVQQHRRVMCTPGESKPYHPSIGECCRARCFNGKTGGIDIATVKVLERDKDRYKCRDESGKVCWWPAGLLIQDTDARHDIDE